MNVGKVGDDIDWHVVPWCNKLIAQFCPVAETSLKVSEDSNAACIVSGKHILPFEITMNLSCLMEAIEGVK